MPPKNNKVGANPLTPQELGLLKLWIDQGAQVRRRRRGSPAPVPAAAAKVEYQPAPRRAQPDLRGRGDARRAARRVQPRQPDLRLQPAEASAPDASHRPRPARHRRRGPAGRGPPRPRPEPRVQPRRQAARVRRLPRGEAVAAARPRRAAHAAGRRDEPRRRARHQPRRQGPRRRQRRGRRPPVRPARRQAARGVEGPHRGRDGVAVFHRRGAVVHGIGGQIRTRVERGRREAGGTDRHAACGGRDAGAGAEGRGRADHHRRRRQRGPRVGDAGRPRAACGSWRDMRRR